MKEYFYDLNYTLANEDTTLEYEMVKKLRPKNILSVCGSGGRALPLIVGGAEVLDAIDISHAQLKLLALRVATIKKLAYDDFLKFWGYPPYAPQDHCDFRRATFSELDLPDETLTFFDTIFNREEWKSILYIGKWERTFQTLNKICRVVLGSACEDIFKHDTIEAQREYVRNVFPWWRWKIVLLLLGNKSLFNALLYKGDFVQKNVEDSHFEYYDKAFRRIFENMNVRESFFLQLCFLGRVVYPEGNTVEAREQAFGELKESLKTTIINPLTVDLITALKGERKYDFVSLSDVPSYFQGDVELNFLQEMKGGLNPGAVLVLRSYLRDPNVDTTGYEDITSEYSGPIEKEAVQMYRIRVFKKV
ncbi:MAG: DUF3419 family protein [Bacteriovoracaceae bacterium]|nr:DUF3419 family protein [Bacteriovoracaceae bacterium]